MASLPKLKLAEKPYSSPNTGLPPGCIGPWVVGQTATIRPYRMSPGARQTETPPLTRRKAGPYVSAPAQVAELVDALVSGTSGASRGGSSPLLGTTPSIIGSSAE